MYVNIILCIEHVASLPVPYTRGEMHVARIPPRSELNKLRGNFAEIRKERNVNFFFFFLCISKFYNQFLILHSYSFLCSFSSFIRSIKKRNPSAKG